MALFPPRPYKNIPHLSQYVGGFGNVNPNAISQFAGQMTSAPLTPGGFTVDTQNPTNTYQDLINSDPLYKQMQSDLSAQGIQNASERAAAIQQAIIGFGEAPTNASSLSAADQGFLGQDVNALTRQLAQQNTAAGLSTIAKLAQQHNQNTATIGNNLAARGMFRSGGTASDLGQEGMQYKQAGNDARQGLLGVVTQAIQGYLAQQASIEAQLRQGAEDAAARAQANLGSGNTGGGGGDKTTDPYTNARKTASSGSLFRLYGA